MWDGVLGSRIGRWYDKAKSLGHGGRWLSLWSGLGLLLSAALSRLIVGYAWRIVILSVGREMRVLFA